MNDIPKAPTQSEIDFAARLAMREDFECVDVWRDTPKGKTREFESMRLTVFRERGRYRWVGTTEDGEKRWSEKAFQKEEHAIADLADFLGVGW